MESVANFPYKIVDLSHPLSSDMPVWPNDPETLRKPHATISEDGYFLNSWTFGEHTGTHIGYPAHFVDGGEGNFVKDAEDLLYRVWVINNQKTRKNISLEDIGLMEKRVGKIPENSLLIMNSGWSKLWPNSNAVFEKDEFGFFKYPGFLPETTEWLIRNRGIAGLGTDTPGVDPGNDFEYSTGNILANAGKIHIENMNNLDLMPLNGAWVLIGALNLENASGSPARIFGLIGK